MTSRTSLEDVPILAIEILRGKTHSLNAISAPAFLRLQSVAPSDSEE
jgi:hypothetical protein